MKKIMLISGCSHAAGSEIDGTSDSDYNRTHSFGNLLAYKMGYEPINIAENGSNNPAILRTTLEWIAKEYNPATMDLFVLVPWTESSRMQFPTEQLMSGHGNVNADWRSSTSGGYRYLNLGYKGGNDEERQMMPYYHKFMIDHLLFLELLSANAILQLQYFLKMKNIDYLMCNTMDMFRKECKHLDFYLEQIDHTKYIDVLDVNKSFFFKYRYSGFNNPKAKYWHHDEEPHRLYADELYKFIEDNYVHNQNLQEPSQRVQIS
jgi:hypothetical protein